MLVTGYLCLGITFVNRNLFHHPVQWKVMNFILRVSEKDWEYLWRNARGRFVWETCRRKAGTYRFSHSLTLVMWVQRRCDAPGPDKGCKQVNMLSIGGGQDGWLRFPNGNLSNPVASCYWLHNSPLRCFSIWFRKVSQFQTLKALFYFIYSKKFP